MAGSLNKVTLIGNLGWEPEVRTTKEGKELVILSLATSEHWKDKATGEAKEKTEWHRIIIFNENLVSVSKNYLKKGAKVYIEGSLRTRKYLDKSGNEKYATEVILQGYNSQLILLDNKHTEGGMATSLESPTNSHFNESDGVDELPF